MVKSFLTDSKITFKEINVAEDKVALEEMLRKSGRMVVPQIEIDGEILVGFDKAKLKQTLGL
jgi:glutaredoxin 3